jgi:hypothetical protein
MKSTCILLEHNNEIWSKFALCVLCTCVYMEKKNKGMRKDKNKGLERKKDWEWAKDLYIVSKFLLNTFESLWIVLNSSDRGKNPFFLACDLIRLCIIIKTMAPFLFRKHYTCVFMGGTGTSGFFSFPCTVISTLADELKWSWLISRNRYSEAGTLLCVYLIQLPPLYLPLLSVCFFSYYPFLLFSCSLYTFLAL